MDFRYTEDQLSIQSIARDFAQKRIAPVAAEFDKSGEFPLDNIREMGQLGLMGIEVPHEYGGAGLDPVAYALAMIEIAAADCAHSTIMSVNNSLYCNGILKYGTEEQKQKYVRAVASGEAIGAYALTEPQSGSDASAMHTRATKNDERRLGHQRQEELDHVGSGRQIHRAVRDHDAGHRRERRVGFPDRHRASRLPRRQDRTEARHPRIGDLRDRIQRVRLPGRRHARSGRQGFRDRDGRARRGTHRHRLAGGRAFARGVRGEHRVGARAQGVRPSDRIVPDDPGQDRRHEVPARCVDAADIARGVHEGRNREERRTFQHRGFGRETVRVRIGDVDHAPGRADPRRHGLLEGNAARTLTSAMRRSPRSTKARARSSGSSSRATRPACAENATSCRSGDSRDLFTIIQRSRLSPLLQQKRWPRKIQSLSRRCGNTTRAVIRTHRRISHRQCFLRCRARPGNRRRRR